MPIKKKNITLLVIGTGGKEYHGGPDARPQLKNMKKGDSELLFHSPNLGTCLLDVTPKKLKLICYNEHLQKEFTHIIRK